METGIRIDIKFIIISFILFLCFAAGAFSYLILFAGITFCFLWFIKAERFDWLLYFIALLIFWQNTWIAFSSGLINDKHTFSVMHGTNFLFPLLIFFLLLFSIRRLPPDIVRLWLQTLLIGCLLMAASIIGGINYGIENSATYLRLFFGPLILFWVGFWLSYYPHDGLEKVLKVVFKISLAVSVLQFIIPRTMILVLNDVNYFNLKIGTHSVDDVMSYLRESTYFNLPIDMQVLRVSGMVKSFISNSYFLIILSVILYWKRSRLFCWLVAAIVSICCASKGAVLFFIFFNIFAFLRHYFSYSVVILMFSLLWAVVVYIGYHASNEHIIGFIAGSKYLLTTGNGLGFSGNLSTIRLTAWDGVPLPDLGYWTRFQNGSESTFGVLFSSLGIFSVFYLIFNMNLISLITKKGRENGVEYLGYLSLLVFAQGIFQEEAFSPFVYGLVLFVAGSTISGKKNVGYA
jgi:hypothetical protein